MINQPFAPSTVWFAFICRDDLSDDSKKGLENLDGEIVFFNSPVGVFGSLPEIIKTMDSENRRWQMETSAIGEDWAKELVKKNSDRRYRRVLDFGNQPKVTFKDGDFNKYDKPDFLQSKEITQMEVWEVISGLGVDVYCFLEVRL